MTPRGFPAFPPGRARRPRAFWGVAWNRVWEADSLDPAPPRAGRRLAAAGHVGPITVSPGRISAAVHDGDTEQAYATRVRVAPLGDADWDRLAGEVSARAGHRAALLARQLPRELVEAAEVGLLPGLGEVSPECDCPDWDHPCRHAAALCHQVSWLLDADPTLLLLIRGRDTATLLATPLPAHRPSDGATGTRSAPVDGSGSPSAGSSPAVGGPAPHAMPVAGGTRDGGHPQPALTGVAVRPGPPSGGTAAAAAYAQLAPPLPVPPGPPGPVELPLLPPAPGVDADALRCLVATAAARATALLAAPA